MKLIWEFQLPVFDWSWRSRHDWNGFSRWRPVGNSILFNWFDIVSNMWINWNPTGFDWICSSSFSIERRNLRKDPSPFSVSWSNEPSLFVNKFSPGGP